MLTIRFPNTDGGNNIVLSTIGSDGLINLWNVPSMDTYNGDKVSPLSPGWINGRRGHTKWINDFCLTDNGTCSYSSRTVATVSSDQNIGFFKISNIEGIQCRLDSVYHMIEAHRDYIKNIDCFSLWGSAEKIITSGLDGYAHIFDMDAINRELVLGTRTYYSGGSEGNLMRVGSINIKESVYCQGLCEKNPVIAFGTSLNNIFLYDANNVGNQTNPIRKIENAHNDVVRGIEMFSGGAGVHMVSGSSDSYVKLWDMRFIDKALHKISFGRESGESVWKMCKYEKDTLKRLFVAYKSGFIYELMMDKVQSDTYPCDSQRLFYKTECSISSLYCDVENGVLWVGTSDGRVEGISLVSSDCESLEGTPDELGLNNAADSSFEGNSFRCIYRIGPSVPSIKKYRILQDKRRIVYVTEEEDVHCLDVITSRSQQVFKDLFGEGSGSKIKSIENIKNHVPPDILITEECDSNDIVLRKEDENGDGNVKECLLLQDKCTSSEVFDNICSRLEKKHMYWSHGWFKASIEMFGMISIHMEQDSVFLSEIYYSDSPSYLKFIYYIMYNYFNSIDANMNIDEYIEMVGKEDFRINIGKLFLQFIILGIVQMDRIFAILCSRVFSDVVNKYLDADALCENHPLSLFTNMNSFSIDYYSKTSDSWIPYYIVDINGLSYCTSGRTSIPEKPSKDPYLMYLPLHMSAMRDDINDILDRIGWIESFLKYDTVDFVLKKTNIDLLIQLSTEISDTLLHMDIKEKEQKRQLEEMEKGQELSVNPMTRIGRLKEFIVDLLVKDTDASHKQVLKSMLKLYYKDMLLDNKVTVGTIQHHYKNADNELLQIHASFQINGI